MKSEFFYTTKSAPMFADSLTDASGFPGMGVWNQKQMLVNLLSL